MKSRSTSGSDSACGHPIARAVIGYGLSASRKWPITGISAGLQAPRLFTYYYYYVLRYFVSAINCCIISVILLCHSFLIISDIDTVIGP